MITKNIIKNDTISKLSHLLNQGFSLENSLSLLSALENNHVLIDIHALLLEGLNIDDILRRFIKDKMFMDIFSCLYPIKGLSNALNDAIAFKKEKEKWMELIKKQLGYPLFLIMFMFLFSIFVKIYLLPQMQLLIQSFSLSIDQSTLFQIQFIDIIPKFTIFIFMILLVIILFVVYSIAYRRTKLIHFLLKIPMINVVLKIYYTLKFSFYFSKIGLYFDNLYDAIDYFYKTSQKTDLKMVLDSIIIQLNKGYELNKIIILSDYFVDSFKKYFDFVLETHQNFGILEHYTELLFSKIHTYLLVFTKSLMIMIYFITGLYIMLLYSVMMMPVLEIISTL